MFSLSSVTRNKQRPRKKARKKDRERQKDREKRKKPNERTKRNIKRIEGGWKYEEEQEEEEKREKERKREAVRWKARHDPAECCVYINWSEQLEMSPHTLLSSNVFTCMKRGMKTHRNRRPFSLFTNDYFHFDQGVLLYQESKRFINFFIN